MFAASKTASVSGGYQISRSLRFNSADSAYLNRTPASATNQKTWTWSAWVKRGTISSLQTLFGTWSANTDAAAFGIYFNSGDTLNVIPWTNTIFTSTAVFRDPSAWYHIVVAFDTTQATASNRIIVYVNGVNQAGTYPLAVTQNANYAINSAQAHRLGDFPASGFNTFGGYMTEVNFIDGQALTPSSFGETNAQTGVWQPKAYSGSYGTNGFYLNFSDNSNTTAATLGKDYSGNGNNWTPNNFSVTAGAGNDSMVDVPTPYGVDTGVGGTVRGNYSTLNPLKNVGGTTTLANGNLDLTNTSSSWGTRFTTIGMSTGQWYWECVRTANTYGAAPGIATEQLTNGDGSTTGGISWLNNGQIQNEGSSSIIAPTYTDNDTLRLAYDADAGTLQVAVNGGSFTTVATGKSGRTWFPVLKAYGATDAILINLGQRPFAYTAPSGFKALCTQNLPTPTIGATTATQAGKYYNAVTYTGNGTSQTISTVGFQPDWVWIKSRSASYSGQVQDAVRGFNNALTTDTTSAEFSGSANYGYVSNLTSSGYDVATGSIGAQHINQNGVTYVAWNWKANGSGSTNTAGSITSTVSANTTSGFSVLTYTGTGANATIGHGLGVAPSMVIVKSRSTPSSSYAARWSTYHVALGNTKVIRLESTEAAATASYWNNTTPTSTVFSVDSDIYGANVSGVTYVAYCFAEVAGYSKFGSYVGNGSTDGPFVYCGFRPAYVLVKRTSTGGVSWVIGDSTRNPSNVANLALLPNVNNAETSANNLYDLTSNGIKLRTTWGDLNTSGETYIFMALAEAPFKYSLAR